MANFYVRNHLILALGCILSVSVAGCNPSGPHRPLAAQESGSPPGSQKQTLTYESVKLIIEQRCSRCHNSGSLNWMDEGRATASARSGVMQTSLVSRTMPKAPSAEASSITEPERQKLLAWISSEMGNSGGGTVPGENDPSIVRDRNLAVTFRCMSCHGPLGISLSGDTPNLAGHGHDYILNRVAQFLTVPAPNPMLTQLQSIAADFKMSPESPEWQTTLAYVAQYFSSLVISTSMNDLVDARARLDPVTTALYEQGKTLFQDNACVGCHLGTDLRPTMIEAPMIFSQKADYLTKRLHEFKGGSGGGIMPGIIKDLTSQNLQALVVYLNNTHPGEVRPE